MMTNFNDDSYTSYDNAIAIQPSPGPWHIRHPGEIEDANGKLLYNLRDCIEGGIDEANAAFIVDAVNLKIRINEAIADKAGYLYPVVLSGKPMVCVSPPLSEAEESRMHREYETNLLLDRERFRRSYYEAVEECNRLREERDELRNLVRKYDEIT